MPSAGELGASLLFSRFLLNALAATLLGHAPAPPPPPKRKPPRDLGEAEIVTEGEQ
jgi:hypothetical protein